MTDALLPAAFTAFAIDSKIHRVAGIDEAGRAIFAPCHADNHHVLDDERCER